jgi:hypothetical protein
VLREAAFLLFREDQVPVGDDVELTLLARDGLGVVSGALVQLGRETRSPAVIAVSDGAVEDLDLHAHEPTEVCGCHLWRMSLIEIIDSRLTSSTRPGGGSTASSGSSSTRSTRAFDEADIFKKLRLRLDDLPTEPVVKGTWR